MSPEHYGKFVDMITSCPASIANRFTTRAATPLDAPGMTQFINIASDGLATYLWSRLAGADEEAREIGRRRAMRDTGGFSYRNATILEHWSEPIGCLIGYPLPDAREEVSGPALPAIIGPLARLEAIATGTWHVNVLAIAPAWRGQGHGSRLIAHAHEASGASGCSGVSLVVSDSNREARRFYARHGFHEVARLPMVKEGWRGSGREWILLVAPAAHSHAARPHPRLM